MILKIKVIPNSQNNAIVGLQGDILKIRIKAPPDKGKANEELISFLADTFQIAKSQIELISGQTSRLKTVKINASIDLDKLKRTSD